MSTEKLDGARRTLLPDASEELSTQPQYAWTHGRERSETTEGAAL
ncbi:MAG TPA: hypothetical protein VFX96_00285 [Pyrinomonadaceae bacterium]|nr:hypothetical protein [Pyrinomonadaceae bacterium]